jgi:type IV pilus assembly protein PilY1
MNAFKKILLTLPLLGALAPATTGLAEDTDIYATDNGAANNPNVLVIIDNSANWAAANQGWPGGIKQGQSELKALRTVIADLDENVNLGLMMFTPGGGTNEDGGYVRFAVRTMNATNKAAFQEMLGDPASCTDGANSLNNTPNCIYQNFSSGSLNESVGTAKTDYSATMFEAFKYFGGYTCPDHATDDVAACDDGTVDASHFGALR